MWPGRKPNKPFPIKKMEKVFKLHLLILCVCVRVCDVRRPEENLRELVLCFHHVVPGNWTWATRSGSKHVYQLSYCTHPQVMILKWWKHKEGKKVYPKTTRFNSLTEFYTLLEFCILRINFYLTSEQWQKQQWRFQRQVSFILAQLDIGWVLRGESILDSRGKRNSFHRLHNTTRCMEVLGLTDISTSILFW